MSFKNETYTKIGRVSGFASAGFLIFGLVRLYIQATKVPSLFFVAMVLALISGWAYGNFNKKDKQGIDFFWPAVLIIIAAGNWWFGTPMSLLGRHI